MEKPKASPDLVKYVEMYLGLFRAEEARRWERINSYPDVAALRKNDPKLLRNFMPLRTLKQDDVVTRKLGEEWYRVGNFLVRHHNGYDIIPMNAEYDEHA